MNKQQIGFIQGVVWAAAFIAHDHNEQSYAVDILKESGISKEDAAAHAAEYDLSRLRKVAIPDMPKGKE
ncbi:MAG: hypothetical protein SWH61_03370 [Thermodesulfobacteriota bacterium]|nr:hypothetical protein [Thermodesulfobacteriota bacterium]